jgi:nucleoside-diphosphate-sugar epimerase
MKAIEHPSAFDIFNIGGKEGHSVNGLLEILAEELQRPLICERSPTPEGVPVHSSINVRKAADLLGFVPETGLSQGIHNYKLWYQEQY